MRPSKGLRAVQTPLSRPSRTKSVGNKIPHSTTYDHESGVVYTEYEISSTGKRNADWIGELKTPSIVRKASINSNGARSLHDMAVIACAKEIRNFTPEHLTFVPWAIAERVWRKIEKDHAESFHIWRTFASTYGTEFANRHNRYMLDIKNPSLPLEDYYKGINSPQHRWLTALRISPKQVTIRDLISISDITNLTVLDLSDGQRYVEDRHSNFEERVMRTWAELAAAGRAFKELRVLLLGWQEYVSMWIFRYLHHFPRLESVIVTDCRNLHQRNRKEWEPPAAHAGWEALHAKRSVKALRPLLNDQNFYVGTVTNCYYECIDHFTNPEMQDFGVTGDELPILECWLGIPKPWTHIIDDFPSTRTIWFQRTVSTGKAAQKSDDVLQADSLDTDMLDSPPTGIRLPKTATRQGIRKFKTSKQNTAGLLADFGM